MGLSNEQVELIAVELEVFLHARDVGVTNIRLVQVFAALYVSTPVPAGCLIRID